MSGATTLLADCSVLAEPFREPLRRASILIEGGRIAAVIPEGEVLQATAARLDCSGATVVAGFWNSHVHFFERKWADGATIPASELEGELEAFTRYGFTSVFDLSSDWENTRCIRDRIRSGEIRGPQILSTGPGLIPRGAMPPASVTEMMGTMRVPLPEVSSAGESAAAVESLLAGGVDAVKLFASGPPSLDAVAMNEETMRAAVEAAHRASRPVFVHPNTAADLSDALAAGADVIAHTTPADAWPDDIRALAERGGAALIPTLSLWQRLFRHDRLSKRERMAAAAAAQLRAWTKAGGGVLFGTDFGVVDADPSDEYRLMRSAGMSVREILASLTSDPADRFAPRARLGRIAPGYRADVVVLNGDPVSNVAALSDARYVIREGKLIFPR